MFQTVGLRNKYWRQTLNRLALVYGLVVFLGFAVVPVAVLTGVLKKTMHDATILERFETTKQFHN